MAKLLKSSWDLKSLSKTGSFYGRYRHTGITMQPPKVPFKAAIDDVFGTHVVFNDEPE